MVEGTQQSGQQASSSVNSQGIRNAQLSQDSSARRLRALSDAAKHLTETDADINGKLLYIEHKSAKMAVLDVKTGQIGFVDTPFQEFFKDDVASGNMNEIELYLWKQYGGLVFLEQEIARMSEGKEDVLPFQTYLTNYSMLHVNGSKAREGHQVDRVKMMIYQGRESHQISPLPEEYKEDKNNKKLFG